MTDRTLQSPAKGRADRFAAQGRWAARLARAGLALAILALFIIGTVVNPAFLSLGNFLNVFTSMALVGIIMVGMTFVLIVGGLADLSVPTTVACGAILSLALQPHIGPLPAFVVAVALAGICGSVNGILVGTFGINPIIAILGVGTIVLGIVESMVGGVIV